MTRILQETRVSLNQLARQEGVAPSTVWRWVLRGIGGVQLEAIRIGGRRYTSNEAFTRFVAATNDQPMPAVTNKQREREQAEARRKLVEAGILN